MTEQELLEASGGESTGGSVIAMVGGKHTVLGKRGPGGVFNLTLDGVQFVESLQDKPAEEAPVETKEPKASKPRTKKAQADQGGEAETPETPETPEATGTEAGQEQGQNIDLGLDELVTAAEKIG